MLVAQLPNCACAELLASCSESVNVQSVGFESANEVSSSCFVRKCPPSGLKRLGGMNAGKLSSMQFRKSLHIFVIK